MSAAPNLDDVAFRALSDFELAQVREFGEERETTAGELLFEAGEASYDLFVVLEGEVEVVRLGRSRGGHDRQPTVRAASSAS